MPRKGMARTDVRRETNRLLEQLAWIKSKEGLDHSVIDKNYSDPISITKAFSEILINDAGDRGYNVARLLGDMILRIWAQSDDDDREEIEKLVNWGDDYMDRLNSLRRTKRS